MSPPFSIAKVGRWASHDSQSVAVEPNAAVSERRRESDTRPDSHDGRVLYMRWEVDRSELCFHHLWTMNPDGTGQMVYFGNHHTGQGDA